MIVSEVPGTTRGFGGLAVAVASAHFRIVDTAGIRKPGKVVEVAGRIGQRVLAKRAIERADVVVLVIDATVGPTDQDGAIAGAAKRPSPTAPRPSTTPWSARPCCGRWRRGSGRPGRPNSPSAWTDAYGVLSGYMISEAYGAQSQAAE